MLGALGLHSCEWVPAAIECSRRRNVPFLSGKSYSVPFIIYSVYVALVETMGNDGRIDAAGIVKCLLPASVFINVDPVTTSSVV